MAVEAFLDGPGEGQAAMVGLHGPAGDDGVRSLGQGVGNGEVQLAGLVAAARAGQQVVPFDPDVDLVVQGLAEGGQKFQRRGFLHIAATGKTGKIHGDSFDGFGRI